LQRPVLSFIALPALLALGSAAACSETFPTELAPPVPPARFDSRPSNTTCLAGKLPVGRVRLEPTFKGYTYPLRMIEQRALGLVYVAEMAGRVKVLDRASGNITTGLDIVAKVAKSGTSMFGMALHPQFPAKPYVYLTVERDPDATTPKDMPFRDEVIRFTSNDGGKTFDPASEKLILRVDRPGELHPVGTLEFGPDGFLYIGVGESNADPNANRLQSLLGSIVRIDIDNGDPYVVPIDNPYVGGGGRPEIWASGFRNPWRFTFDRMTGDIWEGDVGDSSWEEVNQIQRGRDYGWPILEGFGCWAGKPCDPSGHTPPVYAYPHSEGASITGGYVYRGKAMPDLVGKYIFGDYVIGHVWMLEGSGTSAKAVFLNPGGPKPLIASFGEDADGEIYAIGWDDGILYKLVPGETDNTPVWPALLSQTGCVDPSKPTEMAKGLVPYGVNTELWSDGATKRRFIGLPDGTTIHVAADGDFDLPNGAVVVKEFSVDGKRLETRLLRHHLGGEWTGATYVWNDAGTDATLHESAEDKKLPNGQTWAFPSSIQCFVCHTKQAGITLGIETQQLNRDFPYAVGQSTNELTTLSDIGYLDKKLDPTMSTRLPELASSAPVSDRARAYLYANCSQCHRKGGNTGVPMDLRYVVPDAMGKPVSPLAAIGCTPTTFPNVANVKTITPGDPSHSAIFLRMSTRADGRSVEGDYQMPKLATHKVDEDGAAVVSDWIKSLTKCE
jgi:uncharacterized repeat protein (TIGR03806 family)